MTVIHFQRWEAPAAEGGIGERARRQDQLQRAEAAFDPIPFGVEAARAYGRVSAAVLDAGRRPRGRLADLMIASVALSMRVHFVQPAGRRDVGTYLHWRWVASQR